MASRLATAGEQGSNWSAAVWWKPPDTSSFFGQVGVLIHSDQQVLICWGALSVRPAAFVAHAWYRRDRRVVLDYQIVISQLAAKRTKPRELVVAHTYTAGGDPLPVVSEPFERAGVPLLHRVFPCSTETANGKCWRTISRGVGRPP